MAIGIGNLQPKVIISTGFTIHGYVSDPGGESAFNTRQTLINFVTDQVSRISQLISAYLDITFNNKHLLQYIVELIVCSITTLFTRGYLIKQRVMDSWHIPLSARNGMKTLLKVNLLPTGEVINVSVVKSSGDEAFDRSAVQAVRRAEKFEELQQLEPRVFDANFRSFNFSFIPQDLDR